MTYLNVTDPISPDFYKMYIIDCQLLSWKTKLRFSSPFWNTSVPNKRQSSNFGSVAALFWFSIWVLLKNYLTVIYQLFTRCRGISATMNECIYMAIWHSVSASAIAEQSTVKHTNSYVLHFEVTKLNLTKILQNVHKLLLINMLKSTLHYSNPFQSASMPNKRRSSNFGRVTALARVW